MAQKTFTVSNFTLSNSWTYTADTSDDSGTRYDLTTKPSATVADKTFTISGIDTSTITSIVLTWDSTYNTSYSGVYPPDNARVYPGAQNSSGGIVASTGALDGLEDILTSDGKVTVRFRYYQSLPVEYYESDAVSYGVGSCTSSIVFQNVKITVYYGEDEGIVDDEGCGAWIGVSGVARKVKNMYIGVNGVARKVKKAWIGVGGVARLFYQAFVKLLASTGYYATSSTSATASTSTLTVRDPSSGYAAYVFPANEQFTNCTKVTLHFYITSTYGDLTIYTRDGSASWVGYNTPLTKNVATYSASANGWQSVDITADFDASSDGVTRANAAANGVKVYFRGYASTKLAGTSGDYIPYLVIE